MQYISKLLPIRGMYYFDIEGKMQFFNKRSTILYYREENVPIMKTNIRQMSTMSTSSGPYRFHEIFHNEIAKWLPF